MSALPPLSGKADMKCSVRVFPLPTTDIGLPFLLRTKVV
jgi:hypothetical protein